jgi:hypothetical protein
MVTATKEEGMALVDQNANQVWKDAMLELVHRVALKKRTFTADDVFDLLAEQPDPPVTHDRRAFGPIMIRAAKAKWCRKANLPAVNSRRRTLHSSPIQIWESLVYEAPKPTPSRNQLNLFAP